MHRFAAALAALGLFAAENESARVERQVFEGVNAERERNGVRVLVWDAALAAEARSHAMNMAGRRFFGHKDPIRGDLKARLAEREVRWRVCAENLFSEEGYKDPAREAIRGWLASPGHRENMLERRVTHTGVGTALSASGTRYIVQIFTLPLERRPQISKRLNW